MGPCQESDTGHHLRIKAGEHRQDFMRQQLQRLSQGWFSRLELEAAAQAALVWMLARAVFVKLQGCQFCC